MDGAKFDELTRLLADGSSRRRVLGGLIGGATGLLGIRRSGATNDCSEFCNELPPGPQRGQCRSDCAHGTGLFFACEGDPERLCAQSDGTIVCCPDGESCEAGACEAPGCATNDDCADGNPCTSDICDTVTGQCSNPPIDGCIQCSTDDDCNDENDCTTDACVDGVCQNTPIPDCGGGCICEGEQGTGPCSADSDCCDGTCTEEGSCTDGYGEQNCAPLGNFCTSDDTCCSGICQDCACTCLGDSVACASDENCCGGFCASGECCREVDAICTSDDQCCGGHCVNGSCGQGAAGTICRFDGDCINGCFDEDFNGEGICECSSDNYCYDNGDCCAGTTCNPDADAVANGFSGICG